MRSNPDQARTTTLSLADEDAAEEASEQADEPARPRRRGLWLTLGAVVLAGAGAGTWYWQHGLSESASPTVSGPVATAEVTRGTISATETWAGTLGHGSPFTVSATGTGTITRIAAQGTVVGVGAALYHLDEQPVTLLAGMVPMYRDIAPGDTGTDVEQLEANLVALGYDGFTADDEYTWHTEAAVHEWQDDLGAAATGTVSRASVVFMPAGGRVDGVHVDVGGSVQPGSAVLDLTGNEQVVSLEADVDDRDLLAVDTAVTVGLPGGQHIAGSVRSVTVVKAESSGSEGGPGAGEESSGADDTITAVEVTLAEPVGEDLIGSPVDVLVAVDERTDVLLVPISALLALAAGGYGLEVVADDGTTSITAVDTGLFADGRVEVSGEGLAQGTVVGVAGR
ncbi:peptidoglycan-binding protein [Jiangella asiatica]|uniref:Efflux RND transporter periplasmic adaptor subunit n=1 Tax=Jiangella asiatica TaxID=2530372 RepID=A0A4R5CJZ0_9ACTN|nr:peptidoglycan-binding protein [Jiangella asiatica]TDE00572.1 efflux RND transporter periplasmic adaptor subunit [Jiangella asiatica]